MEIKIKRLLKKCTRYLWVIPLAIIIGVGIAYTYVQRNSYTIYSADATLLSLNTDQNLFLGQNITVDDINTSRRIVQDFLGVAYSSRVSNMISRSLNDQGIALTPMSVRGMVAASTSESSNIITITARSTNRNLVIPVANTAADCFSSAIYDLFGVNHLSLLDEAETVRSSRNLNMSTMVVYGAVGGFIFGCGIVYLLALLRKKIRYLDDIRLLPETGDILVIPSHSIK